MNLRLDPRRHTPIYQQIVQQIKHLVAIGDLSPGQQLPTVRALAKQLNVHLNTVARAYDLLDKDGVISAQQGRGSYIAERVNHARLRQHRRDTLQTLIHYTLLEALSLGYTSAEIEEIFRKNLKAWQHQRAATTRRNK